MKTIEGFEPVREFSYSVLYKGNDKRVTLSVLVNAREFYVLRLEAHPRGEGHGGRALEMVKSLAKLNGVPVRLTSASDDPKDQSKLDAFYRRHGFVDDGAGEFTWEAEV